MTPERAPGDAGFSLIEALVAMAVLAVGAVSLLTAAESNTARINDISDRTTARWVAEYRLSQVRLGVPMPAGPVEMMGRDWRAVTRFDATTDPGLQRVTIRVGAEGTPTDATLVLLTGYVDQAARALP